MIHMEQTIRFHGQLVPVEEAASRLKELCLEEAEKRRWDEDLSALPPRLAEEIAAAVQVPKSHFIARAKLSYQLAWLCRHYPAAYSLAVFALPTPHRERLI